MPLGTLKEYTIHVIHNTGTHTISPGIELGRAHHAVTKICEEVETWQTTPCQLTRVYYSTPVVRSAWQNFAVVDLELCNV